MTNLPANPPNTDWELRNGKFWPESGYKLHWQQVTTTKGCASKVACHEEVE